MRRAARFAAAAVAVALGRALPGAGRRARAAAGALAAAWRAAGRRPAAGARTLVDTSVLVDGRVAGVAEAGFLPGTLVVPAFVRDELRGIAGDADPLRRRRGRRGLETLERLGRAAGVTVEADDRDVPGIRAVDDKLIALARRTGSRLLTNDVALGERAARDGVAVLSVAALAEAVRPIALPGETLALQVVKDGREPGQGVGYLPDGTMVVVEGGRALVGQTVDVSVTTVLQTRAGRLVFARPRALAPSPR